MAERDEQGLRGPVRICVTETIHQGGTLPDGGPYPERAFQYTTEYDISGRIVARVSRNSNGSDWVVRYIYDESGCLLKTETNSGNEGEPKQETVYSYDQQGRPLEIAASGKTGDSVRFQYDERGRKSKVQVSRPEDYRPHVAVSADSPFWAADRAPNLPGGGTATTFYDEQDRPVEVIVRNSEGDIVSRATRSYDEQGNICEEMHASDVSALLSPDVRARLLQESGISLEELREQFTKKIRPHSIAYTYDDKGRRVQTRRQTFGGNTVKDIMYNEHGDIALEISREERVHDLKEGTPTSAVYSEVQYSYQYDTHGNWTEQKTSYRSTPEGEFVASTKQRRTLTYY